MSQLPLRSAAQPRPEASPPAVAPRTARDRDGLFIVDGPMRIHLPDAPPPLLTDRFAADERERRDHIRRWARMMIVHLERADFHAPQEDYVPTLERLQHLLQREIDAVREGGED
jgi:hypothetical protein